MSGVQSVERAVALLREVGRKSGGLVDLSDRVGLATSTAARILGTLEREGVLRRDSAGVYLIGPEIIAMAGPAATVDIISVARPPMIELARTLGEAVALSVPSGGTTTTVCQIDSPKPVQAQDWTGTTVPLHAGCVGLVTMAFWEDEEIDKYLDGSLDRFNDQTVTDPDAIRSRIALLRRGRDVWTDGEFVEGLTSIASAVRDELGQPVAALYAYGPSYRFPDPTQRDEAHATWVGDQLRQQALQISSDLGFIDTPILSPLTAVGAP